MFIGLSSSPAKSSTMPLRVSVQESRVTSWVRVFSPESSDCLDGELM